MQLNPYLAFNGECEDAMNFYKDCLGGEIESLNRFKDGPKEMMGEPVPEHLLGKVMHMTLRFDENVIMASDSMKQQTVGGNVTLSIGMDSVEKMDAIFNKLSSGGEVSMPLQDTFWGARFGMFTDKFGVSWMFNCHGKNE